MQWIMARAVEPSTWKGIGWLLVAAGLLPVDAVPVLVAAGSAVVGMVEVVRREKP